MRLWRKSVEHGLTKESLIRLNFLAISPQDAIAGTIGKIS